MDPRVTEIRMQGWADIIKAQASSGLNKKEWCEKNGIKRHQFFRMQRILRNQILATGEKESLQRNHRSIPECPLSGIETSKTVSGETVFVELPTVTSATAPAALSVEKPVIEEIRTSPVLTVRHGKFSVELSESVSAALLQKVLKVISDVD